MGAPGEDYAKWNKPVRERNIPYDFSHIWNLWTNWTSKENGDRLINGEQDDSRGWGSGGMEGLSKKEKGLLDMDNSVLILGRGDIRGPNGNGKKYNKD